MPSALLLQGPPGMVVSIQDPAAQGVLPLVTLKDDGGGSSQTPGPFTPTDNPFAGRKVVSGPGSSALSFQAQKTLITGIAVSQQANFQFLHTLGGEIYIYVFGDRIGQLTISGLCVASSNCTVGLTSGQHGLEYLLAYYKKNRLSTRAKPISVLVGRSTTLTGFLAGMQTSVADHKLSLVQFALSMMLLPD